MTSRRLGCLIRPDKLLEKGSQAFFQQLADLTTILPICRDCLIRSERESCAVVVPVQRRCHQDGTGWRLPVDGLSGPQTAIPRSSHKRTPGLAGVAKVWVHSLKRRAHGTVCGNCTSFVRVT